MVDSQELYAALGQIGAIISRILEKRSSSEPEKRNRNSEQKVGDSKLPARCELGSSEPARSERNVCHSSTMTDRPTACEQQPGNEEQKRTPERQTPANRKTAEVPIPKAPGYAGAVNGTNPRESANNNAGSKLGTPITAYTPRTVRPGQPVRVPDPDLARGNPASNPTQPSSGSNPAGPNYFQAKPIDPQTWQTPSRRKTFKIQEKTTAAAANYNDSNSGLTSSGNKSPGIDTSIRSAQYGFHTGNNSGKCVYNSHANNANANTNNSKDKGKKVKKNNKKTNLDRFFGSIPIHDPKSLYELFNQIIKNTESTIHDLFPNTLNNMHKINKKGNKVKKAINLLANFNKLNGIEQKEAYHVISPQSAYLIKIFIISLSQTVKSQVISHEIEQLLSELSKLPFKEFKKFRRIFVYSLTSLKNLLSKNQNFASANVSEILEWTIPAIEEIKFNCTGSAQPCEFSFVKNYHKFINFVFDISDPRSNLNASIYETLNQSHKQLIVGCLRKRDRSTPVIDPYLSLPFNIENINHFTANFLSATPSIKNLLNNPGLFNFSSLFLPLPFQYRPAILNETLDINLHTKNKDSLEFGKTDSFDNKHGSAPVACQTSEPSPASVACQTSEPSSTSVACQTSEPSSASIACQTSEASLPDEKIADSPGSPKIKESISGASNNQPLSSPKNLINSHDNLIKNIPIQPDISDPEFPSSKEPNSSNKSECNIITPPNYSPIANNTRSHDKKH